MLFNAWNTTMSNPSKATTSLRSFARFRDETGGMIAPIFALMAVPLVFMSGAAIDYSRSTESKAGLQQALDSALLAAAKNGNSNAAAFKTSVESLNGRPTSTATISRVQQPDGGYKYNGAATASVSTAFMAIAGTTTIDIAANAQATTPGQILTVKVTPTQTSGAFSKDIFIWTKDAQGNVTSRQTILTYRYTYYGPSNWTKVNTPALGTSSTNISVPTYATYGLGMVIYQDMTWRGAVVNPTERWSDASNASTFVRQTGQCTDPGGATFNWEDGGDSNFADFVYTMTCTVGVAPGAVTRLSQ